ncbi:hypothetical protein ONZ45_g5428 [Pleurotus djamor]|nr:hypothetical protein ONZ45_g5428 [Pleurotus djamor]
MVPSDFPAEVLSMIFIYAQGPLPSSSTMDVDAANATSITRGRPPWLGILSVCRRWRRIFLETPQLWSRIHLGLDFYLHRVNDFLERSKATPLDVVFSYEYTENENAGPCECVDADIMDASERFRTLEIEGSHLRYIYELLGRRRSMKAPFLEELSLAFYGDGYSSESDTDDDDDEEEETQGRHLPVYEDLFWQEMPSLKRLSVHTIPLPSSFPSLPTLLELHLWTQKLSVTTLLDILERTPNVEILRLSKLLRDNALDGSHGSHLLKPHHAIQLPRLRELDLCCDDLGILNALDFPYTTLSSFQFGLLRSSTPTIQEFDLGLLCNIWLHIVNPFHDPSQPSSTYEAKLKQQNTSFVVELKSTERPSPKLSFSHEQPSQYFHFFKTFCFASPSTLITSLTLSIQHWDMRYGRSLLLSICNVQTLVLDYSDLSILSALLEPILEERCIELPILRFKRLIRRKHPIEYVFLPKLDTLVFTSYCWPHPTTDIDDYRVKAQEYEHILRFVKTRKVQTVKVSHSRMTPDIKETFVRLSVVLENVFVDDGIKWAQWLVL